MSAVEVILIISGVLALAQIPIILIFGKPCPECAARVWYTERNFVRWTASWTGPRSVEISLEFPESHDPFAYWPDWNRAVTAISADRGLKANQQGELFKKGTCVRCEFWNSRPRRNEDGEGDRALQGQGGRVPLAQDSRQEDHVGDGRR